MAAVAFDDRADSEEIKNLIETLDSQGFTAEPQEVEVSETVEARLPPRWTGCASPCQPACSLKRRCKTSRISRRRRAA
ncbi:MAG: hypothetical protein ACLU38_08710 [Dysosmobacter sp.]